MDTISGDPGSSFPANGFPGLLDWLDRTLVRIGSRHHFGFIGRLHAAQWLTARSLLVALMALLLLLVLPTAVGALLRRSGRTEENFRGDRIPQSYGLLILLWAGAMLWWSGFLIPWIREENRLWLVAVIGFGLLGLLDDVWGTKKIKGLRGHFMALLRERKVTTGLIKAVGGLTLAGWLVWQTEPNPAWLGLPLVLLIALAANAINLLDLRPGRAGAVFLLAGIPLLWFGAHRDAAGVPPLLYIFVPALAVWRKDAAARVMMGDVGSNLLGGALGLALVTFAPLAVQLLALLLLIGLHLLTEKRSLTTLIAETPWLRRLDHLTGDR